MHLRSPTCVHVCKYVCPVQCVGEGLCRVHAAYLCIPGYRCVHTGEFVSVCLRVPRIGACLRVHGVYMRARPFRILRGMCVQDIEPAHVRVRAGYIRMHSWCVHVHVCSTVCVQCAGA